MLSTIKKGLFTIKKKLLFFFLFQLRESITGSLQATRSHRIQENICMLRMSQS